METQTIHLLQPPQRGWRILIILVCVASFIALTGSTSPFAAVSSAPTLENGTAEGAKAPDTRWPDGNAGPAEKCPQCGVVTAMREIVTADTDAAGAQPGSVQKKLTRQQEVTVRMRDGSRHVFREASPSIWRVGERMIIIDSDLHAGA